MKYLVGIICIVLVIGDYCFEINPIARNIIYGLMSLFVIVFLYTHRQENGLKNMFQKKEDGEKKSLFKVKNWFN